MELLDRKRAEKRNEEERRSCWCSANQWNFLKIANKAIVINIHHLWSNGAPEHQGPRIKGSQNNFIYPMKQRGRKSNIYK